MKTIHVALVCFGLWLAADRAEGEDPRTAREYLNRGKLHSDKGTFDKALADFNAAIRLDPKMAEAYYWRGIVCGLNYSRFNPFWGDFADKWCDDAIRNLEQCVRLEPTHHRAHARLGGLYSIKQKHYQALAAYTEAVRLNPKDKESAAKIETTTKFVRETWKRPAIKVVLVALDPELKKVVTKKSPPYALAAGTEKTVEDTVRVHHTTTITSTWKADVELRGKMVAWGAELGLAIRGGYERTTGQTYGVETEKKRSVTIKSKDPVHVVWVDLYRTGKAKVEVDGRQMELPFEFKEDFDLLTEPVRSGPSQ